MSIVAAGAAAGAPPSPPRTSWGENELRASARTAPNRTNENLTRMARRTPAPATAGYANSVIIRFGTVTVESIFRALTLQLLAWLAVRVSKGLVGN
jgi:hypothetical protein